MYPSNCRHVAVHIMATFLPAQWSCRTAFTVSVYRSFSVPGDTVHTESRHRLLFHPGLHSEHPGRHSVVGVVLDQRGGLASTCLSRPAHRADNDHHERRCTSVAASSVVHQGRRRVDDAVPAVRVRVADRVRGGQCAGASFAASNRCASSPFTLHCHLNQLTDKSPMHCCCHRPPTTAGKYGSFLHTWWQFIYLRYTYELYT